METPETVTLDLTSEELLAVGIILHATLGLVREVLPPAMIEAIHSFGNKVEAGIEAQVFTDWDKGVN
jgi:hypothetical protein